MEAKETIAVILDTNFLMIPSQFKVDIFSEIKRIMHEPYKLYVIDKTLAELKNVMTKAKKGSDKAAARLALSFIDRYGVGSLETPEGLYADLAIIGVAEPSKHIVCTQDMGLKRELKKKGVARIVMRKKQYLILDE